MEEDISVTRAVACSPQDAEESAQRRDTLQLPPLFQESGRDLLPPKVEKWGFPVPFQENILAPTPPA